MGNIVSHTDTQSSIILKLYKLSQQDLNLISTKLNRLTSDENNCNDTSAQSIFSSDTEMIESLPLRCVFWLMSFLIISSNLVVIYSTLRLLCYAVNMKDPI